MQTRRPRRYRRSRPAAAVSQFSSSRLVSPKVRTTTRTAKRLEEAMPRGSWVSGATSTTLIQLGSCTRVPAPMAAESRCAQMRPFGGRCL
eukprot:scaffold1735_cov119-Isochrysis_galbana.AAC.17